VKGSWAASKEHHAYAVASLRAHHGWRPTVSNAASAGGSSSSVAIERSDTVVTLGASNTSVPLLQLLLGPRVALQPTVLAIAHGSARDAGESHATSSSSTVVAKQKQVALERILNKLGQNGALDKLRAFDASRGGAAVSFAWAARLTRYLKHKTLCAAGTSQCQPIADASCKNTDQPGDRCEPGLTTPISAESASTAGLALAGGVTRLPAALLGEWRMIEQAGFEVGETHRWVPLFLFLFAKASIRLLMASYVRNHITEQVFRPSSSIRLPASIGD